MLTGKVARVDFVRGDDLTAVSGALLQLAAEIEVRPLPCHLLQVELRQPTNRRASRVPPPLHDLCTLFGSLSLLSLLSSSRICSLQKGHPITSRCAVVEKKG